METNNKKAEPIFTDRLILRPFTEADIPEILKIFSDEKTNQYLPWFPLQTLEEARKRYEDFCLDENHEPAFGCYAICLKEDNVPIGWIDVDFNGANEVGYGLRHEYWHQKIASEALQAVIRKMKEESVPYLTATHDRNNPNSGYVMKKAGMKYQYSYEEDWQPKNFKVTFRLYLINLDGNEARTFDYYWNKFPVHEIEKDVYERQSKS